MVLDDIGMTNNHKGMSVKDKRAMKKLESSTRLVDGQYEVGMLWKIDTPWLPNNRSSSEARLQSLKRKLKKDKGMHGKSQACMDNMLDKGYARKLTEEESRRQSRNTWYLPHRAVFHPRKPDKIRVVFDAAALHDAGSLNSHLQQGPDLTNSLLGVLMQFRQEPIAGVEDIEAMFLQVKTLPEDTDALHFLWWEDGSLEKATEEYQMLRHIFGAAGSPSCCNYSLIRTVEDNQTDFSDKAVRAVKGDLYVDDLLTGERTVVDLIREITALLQRGGFRIAPCEKSTGSTMGRWQGCISVRDSETRQASNKYLGATYGVRRKWRKFPFTNFPMPVRMAMVYVPTSGLWAPVDRSGAHFWKDDQDVLPWSLSQLQDLSCRLLHCLPGFIRPSRRNSYQIDHVTFWTDSQTTLQYVTNETKRFHVYVTNRVAEICDVTEPKNWRHCPGLLNPADDALQGQSFLANWLSDRTWKLWK